MDVSMTFHKDWIRNVLGFSKFGEVTSYEPDWDWMEMNLLMNHYDDLMNIEASRVSISNLVLNSM